MSIELNPGFIGNIEIKNSCGKSLYETRCSSPKEVKEFFKTYSSSKSGWSLIRGILFPLRTGSRKELSKDLFLPTFEHYAKKIHHFVLKIFASKFAIALDLVTLPVRLVATPFRVAYNQKNPEEKHALILLLGSINEEVVTIHYRLEDVTSESVEEDSDVFQSAKKVCTTGSVRVALRRLPGGIKEKSHEKTENISYLGMNGKWTVSVSSKEESHHSSFAF